MPPSSLLHTKYWKKGKWVRELVIIIHPPPPRTSSTTMRNLRSNSRSLTSNQSISVANESTPSSKESPNNKIESSTLGTANEIIAIVGLEETENQPNTINAANAVVINRNSSAVDIDSDNKVECSAESTGLLASVTGLAFNHKDMTKTSNKSKGKAGPGNELTHLIPGYTAPMRLESKLGSMALLQHQSGSSGIANHAISLSKLRQLASLSEVARYIPPTAMANTTKHQPSNSTASFLSTGVQKSNTTAAAAATSFVSSSSYRKTHSKIHDHTAGSGWFHMNPTHMTNQLKTDLSLIRNRNYLDPKKFYKSADSFDGKILQVGTVIEGSSEYYSSRMTRRERRMNITEELMADANVRQYAKRKYLDIQLEKERSSSSKNRGGGKQKHGRKGGRR